MIKRELSKTILEKIGRGKTIVIFGARQVGKTTLLHEILKKYDNILWLNGDDINTQSALEKASIDNYRPLVSGYDIVVIDEAQRIENIGLKLKLLQDNFGDKVQFIATGSSSFELANKINEPLTGRKYTFWLPSLTISELKSNNGDYNERANLPNRLLYGSYPAVVTRPSEAKETIKEIANDNLYRDVLNLNETIRTDRLRRLLQALAFQAGSQVSMNELAELIGIDHKTVARYIALLEQAFIIFRLPSFSRNLRNELKSSQKIYFYDNGIRNAIINDFRPVEIRQDIGLLFENYIVSELKKKYPNDNIYFWRTTDQQEIDFILEKDGEVSALEIKYSENKNVRFPNSFVQKYNPKETLTINRENYLDILS